MTRCGLIFKEVTTLIHKKSLAVFFEPFAFRSRCVGNLVGKMSAESGPVKAGDTFNLVCGGSDYFSFVSSIS